MAYVPGFGNDLFLSYAHVDNEVYSGEEIGWVTQFGNDLRIALDELIGRKGLIQIWRDRQLGGADDISETIAAQVRSSAILLPVLSPGYLASGGCSSELAEFASQRHRLFGSPLAGNPRIFKVLCRHVEEQRHPRAMRDSVGYPFCLFDQETETETRLFATRDGRPDQRYRTEVSRLARQLANRITTMARMATVYVAETEDTELLPFRSLLVRFLRQCGFRILPEERLEPALATIDATMEADLRRSALSVHLAGTKYGAPRFEGLSRMHLAFRLAASRQNSLRPPVVWRPTSIKGEAEPAQQAFFNELYEENTQRFAAEQLAVDIEEIRTDILDRTFPHLVEPQSLSRRPEPDPLIYISYLPVDGNQRDAVERVLRTQQCDLLASPGSVLSERERQNLLRCSGMVIIYGEAPADWVRSMALDARDIIAAGSSDRMRRFSIVLTPPEQSKQDLGLSFRSLSVIDCTTGLHTERLSEFVQSLRG